MNTSSGIPQHGAASPTGQWHQKLRRMTGNVWFTAVILAMIASVLRFYALDKEALWLDEGYSWWDAQQSLADLWHLVPQCDPHPPLYFFLLKLWIAVIGDTSAQLRMLGGLFGVLATLTVWLAGREISPRAGWMAGLVFATMPFQVEFAQEARPYTLFCLGAALLTYGLLRLTEGVRLGPVGHGSIITQGPAAKVKPARFGVAALVVGGTLAMWSNSTAALVLTGAALALSTLFVFDKRSRGLFKPFLLAAVLIIVLWLPYVPTFISQMQGVSSDFWIPRPDFWRLKNEMRFVVGMASFDALPYVLLLGLAGLVALLFQNRWREVLLLSLFAMIPVALSYWISKFATPIFLARALICFAPPFAVLVGAGFAVIRWRIARYALLAGLIASQLTVTWALYQLPIRKEAWVPVAHHLLNQAHGKSIVLTLPDEMALPLGHAFKTLGTELPVGGVPGDFPEPGIEARYPSGKCDPSAVGQDLRPLLVHLRSYDTVFFISRPNNTYDPKEEVPAFFRSHGYHQVGMKDFRPGYLRVFQFEPDAASVAGTASSTAFSTTTSAPSKTR